MAERGKFYVGTVDNIMKAAILYDIFTLQSKGTKAKTNFNMTTKEIKAILQLPSIMMVKLRLVKLKKKKSS